MYKEVVTDVFFDLDHTLWDFDRNSALTFGKILAENGVCIDLDDFLRAYVPVNREFWKYFREGKINSEEMRIQRLQATFNALNQEVGQELLRVLSKQYIEHLTSFSHLLPHAREILAYLSPRYKIHIVTNGFREIQDKKLRNAGIYDFFDHIIYADTAGTKKPDPAIFRLALQQAGTVPERSIMIGDCLEADILGAKAVGFHVLHLNAHKEPPHDHSAMIQELSAIKLYL